MAKRQKYDDRTPEEKARDTAMRMLAMREHSVRELEQKLRHKGFARDLVDALVTELGEDRLVSDDRYTEMLVRSRMSNGYGPVRIAHELREKGVSDEIVSQHLNFDDKVWMAELERVRELKFSDTRPTTYQEWAKRATFLSNRGFTSDQVRSVLGDYQS